MIPTVVISARGEERLRSGHPWIYRSDLAEVRAEPGEAVAVRGPRNRTLGLAFYSSRSQIALRMLMRGHIEDPAAVGVLLRQRVEAARRVPPVARHRRDRLPSDSRRSRPAALADRRSVRRVPRRPGAVSRHGPSAAGGGGRARRAAAAARHSRAQRCEGAPARRSGAAGRGPRRRGAGPRPRHGTRNRVRGRPPVGTEDRSVSRPAGKSRRRGALRARAAARLLQLPRRLRADAGAAVRRDDRD